MSTGHEVAPKRAQGGSKNWALADTVSAGEQVSKPVGAAEVSGRLETEEIKMGLELVGNLIHTVRG